MKIKVWEPLIRIFHWLLAGLVVLAMVTSFEENWLKVHLIAGHGILLLLVFRLGWGFLGNEYARFSDFLKSPQLVLRHLGLLLQGKNPRYLGHNPLAGWWMIAMLLVLMGLIGSGVVLMGGQEQIGLLAQRFTLMQASNIAPWHEVLAWVIMAMAGAHAVAAILESFHQKENLVASMVHGNKDQRETPVSTPVKPKKGLQWGFTGLILLLLLLLVFVWPMDHRAEETLRADRKEALEGFEEYQQACGECHFEFSPNLLPQRSWEKMLGELEDHFGDDASLDEDLAQTIQKYLLAHSLETSRSEWSFYLGRDLPKEQEPLRFSETEYWKSKHHDIEKSTYEKKSIRSKLNCGACHPDAAYGSYEDDRIEIPKD